jgi:DNA-binding MarR family transcriptional regulator
MELRSVDSASAPYGADDPSCPGTQKGTIMAVNPSADQLVGILRETVVSLVRRDGPDLSARQLGVFLTCYLLDGGHTVRGLAADLNVSKPAITRALDRLGELDLARRKVDPLDRRSILVQRTLKGAAFLRDLRSIMGEASSTAKRAPQSSASETSHRRATA